MWVINAGACAPPEIAQRNDVGPALGFILLPLLAILWSGMVGYLFLSWWLLRRYRGRRVLVSCGIAVGAVLCTWGYWAVMIPLTFHPDYFATVCHGEYPQPFWFPVPLPDPYW